MIEEFDKGIVKAYLDEIGSERIYANECNPEDVCRGTTCIHRRAWHVIDLETGVLRCHACEALAQVYWGTICARFVPRICGFESVCFPEIKGVLVRER